MSLRTKILAVAACLLLCLPVYAQPNSDIGHALYNLGCRSAGICPDNSCTSFIVGAFNPDVSPFNPDLRIGWVERYGIPWGTHNNHAAGWSILKQICSLSSNPCNLQLPYVWTSADNTDASILLSGNAPPPPPGQSYAVISKSSARTCYSALVDRFLPDCWNGWSCEPPTPEISEQCRNGELRCRGAVYDLPMCYQLTTTGRVFYNTARTECIPGIQPAPVPVCGNGQIDTGETCLSCPQDAGVCPPPIEDPPVEDPQCDVEKAIECLCGLDQFKNVCENN